MHIIAPAAVLAQNPLKNAVALVSLSEASASLMDTKSAVPEGAARLAVSVNGTESEEEVAALKVGVLEGESLARCQSHFVLSSLSAFLTLVCPARAWMRCSRSWRWHPV